MNVLELWDTLARAPLDARVVLQLPDGHESDVTSAQCHCQLVVVTADIPVDEPLDNSVHIDEAMVQYPAEDFLYEAIEECTNRELRAMLEEIQSEVNRASDYGREELNKALAEIKEV